MTLMPNARLGPSPLQRLGQVGDRRRGSLADEYVAGAGSFLNARRTRSIASLSFNRNRVICGSVTVSASPALIWRNEQAE